MGWGWFEEVAVGAGNPFLALGNLVSAVTLGYLVFSLLMWWHVLFLKITEFEKEGFRDV